MGLWDRLRGVGPGGRLERRAQAHERAGNLTAASDAYLEAGLPEEAARLQIVRADAEARPAERMMLFRAAAKLAPGSAAAKDAATRAAQLRYELVRGRGAVMRGEILGAAEELMEVGAHRLAADAFAEAGDKEREVAALVQAGALSEVEEKLDREVEAARVGNELALTLRRARDLDSAGDRREALALLDRYPDDSTARDLRVRIVQRVARGPLVRVREGGEERVLALAPAVTIGRGDATLVVPSPQISRLHVELFRGADGAPRVRDLDTKNGTLLGGARVDGELPVGAGLSLRLGGEVPCVFAAEGEGVRVEVGPHAVHAPLGPHGTPAGTLDVATQGEPFVEFHRADADVFLRGLAIGPVVQLAEGDELCEARDAEPFLVVLGRGEGA